MVDMRNDNDNEVIEPEILPPDPNNRGSEQRPTGQPDASIRWVRLGSALFAGLIMDLADLATPIPHGALLGTLVGWYICRTQEVPKAQRVWWIAAATLYCAIPRTGFFPLATLILIYRALTKR